MIVAFKRALAIMLVFVLLLCSSACTTSPITESNTEKEQTSVENTDLPTYDWQHISENYTPNDDDIAFDEEAGCLYLKGVVLAFFDSDASDAQIDQAVEAISGKIIGRTEGLNMFEIEVPVSSIAEIQQVADTLMKDYPFVIHASYESATEFGEQTAVAPNDPWNSDTKRDDWTDNDIDGSNWWIEAIEAQYAWGYNDNLAHINIGIIDSSFDTGHEDLKNRYQFPNKITELRNQTVFTSIDISKEPHYHGTHVAGIIGAEPNNKKGITGLVWNSTLFLAPAYTKGSDGKNVFTDATIYASLNYLVEAGAKVVNVSIGKSGSLTNSVPAYSEDVLLEEGSHAAIVIANLLSRGYDFVVVQSAGNGNEDGVAVDARQNGLFASITKACTPGTYGISIQDVLDHVIIVGAAEQNNSKYQCTSFSNYGDQVSICAPGKNIYSTVPGDTFWGFEFTGGYAELSGTSMAAPIVTGVCAMVWAADTSLSGAQAKEIVCSNTSRIAEANPSTSSTKAYNMVNARLAVEAAMNTPLADSNNIADSFSEVIYLAEDYVGYSSFSAEQRDLCCGDIFEINGEKALCLFYKVPGGAKVPSGYYVELWVERGGKVQCMTKHMIENSDSPDVTVCCIYIRKKDEGNYLNTYLRIVGQEDISKNIYYSIGENLDSTYDLFSKERIVSMQDGLIVHDESSAYYAINQEEVSRSTFYSKQDELNLWANSGSVIELNPVPNYSEGIPPQGKTYEELLELLSSDGMLTYSDSKDLSQYIGGEVETLTSLFDDITKDSQYYSDGTCIYSNSYITFDEDHNKNIYSIMLQGPSSFTICGISYGMVFKTASDLLRGKYIVREDRDGYLMVEGEGYYLSISAFQEDYSIGDTISFVTIMDK